MTHNTNTQPKEMTLPAYGETEGLGPGDRLNDIIASVNQGVDSLTPSYSPNDAGAINWGSYNSYTAEGTVVDRTTMTSVIDIITVVGSVGFAAAIITAGAPIIACAAAVAFAASMTYSVIKSIKRNDPRPAITQAKTWYQAGLAAVFGATLSTGVALPAAAALGYVGAEVLLDDDGNFDLSLRTLKDPVLLLIGAASFLSLKKARSIAPKPSRQVDRGSDSASPTRHKTLTDLMMKIRRSR